MEENYIRIKSRRKIDKLTYHCDEGVEWFSFPILDRFDFVRAGFSTRVGGVSEGAVGSLNLSLAREVAMNKEHSEEICREKFRENHERLARVGGYETDSMIFTNQMHTNNIKILTDMDRGNGFTKPNEYYDIDGLMTDITGQTLMTFSADCVLLLLVDPVHKAIANLHSGWRGTVIDIGGKAVQMMQQVYGSDPKKLIGAIAPCICQDCYEVSKNVIDQFKEKYDEQIWPELFSFGRITETGEQKYQLNLVIACQENFLQAGMKRENLSLPDLCTSCNWDYLYSHRRSRGMRGNQAAFIYLR